ncbi:MAG TPA: carboxypeptidase-like regulatory domain-containing protein [Candidatus Acidoferrales bacterium]|nr:carboxypeptidase-like regulatory domain-containing protein [Candidatus Acidoferrales bacterium]
MSRFGFAFFLLLLFSCAPARAQDTASPPGQAQSADSAPKGRLSGTVGTSNAVPIPGATLRLVETSSGRAWVSWTDENGHFDLPGLPFGHYKIEVTQLGFDTATQQFDLSNTPSAITVTLKIASLETIQRSAAAQDTQRENLIAPAGNEAPPAVAPNSRSSDNPQASPQTPSGGGFRRRRLPGSSPGSDGQQNGDSASAQTDTSEVAGAGPRGQNFGGRRGGFQQVLLNNQNGLEGRQGDAGEQSENGNGEQGPLGQAASSDAVLMNGTVGQGDQNAGFGGFPPGGVMIAGPGNTGPNGFGGTGGTFSGGAPMGNPGGAATPGLPGGGFAGPGAGPVIAFQPRGGGRPGPNGRGAPPQRGVAALYGMQRVLRQRINRLRASFYNEYSNSAFNARPYSLTQPDAPKIPTWSERIGGNLGGPLVIPHVYDGHDKTFMFVNFDGTWARNAVDQFSTVPTEAERGGNFCDRGAQLYIPNPADLNGARTPAGCDISSHLNPTALGLLQYIPEPNLPGFVENYHLQTRVPTQQDRLNARVLHTISPTLNARIFYGFSQSTNHAFQSFPGFESDVATRGQSVTLGLTQNLSRTWINDSQFIFSRNRVQTLNNFAFTNDVAGDLGISGVSTAPIDWAVPQLSFNNFTKAAPAVPSLLRNQTYRFVDGVTYMLPKHTVTFGGEVRRIENNTATDPIPEGLFTFSGLVTSLIGPNGQPVPGTGLDFADFLLGYADSTNVRFGAPSNYFRSWGTAGYVSDDWRARSDLTLQFGVRYEFFTPLTELYGHLSNLDYNPMLGQVAVVIPGQAAPFSGALPNSLIRPDYNNWSPRLGIAWRPPIKALQGKRNTVVRAGYSLFYNESVYTQLLAELANQPPWSNSQLRITGPADVLTLQDGFPASVAAQNTIHNTYAVNPNYKVGYAQIWNLAIETTIANNTALVLTYTGTKGTNLDLLFAPNRALPGSLSPTGPIANAGDFIYDTSGANSIYNSLQVRLQKRLSHGIMINGTYTYAKSIDDASSIGGGTPIVVQDSANLGAEYGLSSFDIRQQARINYLYELPLGEGHRFAQKGLTAALFGNWRFSGNIGAQTGTPYTAEVLGTSAANVGGGGIFATRADQICNANAGALAAPLDFFNTNCFVVPSAGQLGNAGRNTIIGPGMFIWNAQFGKTFPFGKDHEHRVDFRWEVMNTTNTPNLTGLSTLVNSATFGQVTGAGAMRAMNVVTRFTF